jgi:hypothetical protein
MGRKGEVDRDREDCGWVMGMDMGWGCDKVIDKMFANTRNLVIIRLLLFF